MKKIVRLTESDLVRLVKRVISEETGKPVNGVPAKTPITFEQLVSYGYKIPPAILSDFENDELEDSGIIGIGSTQQEAEDRLNEKLIKPTTDGRFGFAIFRQLENKNYEAKFIHVK